MINLFILIICLSLGGILWKDINSINQPLENRPSPSMATNKNNPVVFDEIMIIPEKTDYKIISERPLFNQTRRPITLVNNTAKKKIPEKKKQALNKEIFLLSAVVITPNQQLAVLQSNTDRKLERINLGEEYKGWTLAQVEPNFVKLKMGSEEKILDLEIKKSSPRKPAKPGLPNGGNEQIGNTLQKQVQNTSKSDQEKTAK